MDQPLFHTGKRIHYKDDVRNEWGTILDYRTWTFDYVVRWDSGDEMIYPKEYAEEMFE